MMKYYNIGIQVEFDAPRQMPPQQPSEKAWRAVGYFQIFYCTEHSKEKAKQLVYDYFVQHEDNPSACQFRFEHVAWMRGVTKREQIAQGFTADLTEEMFNQRNQIGIWYCGEKTHYVSEQDAAADMVKGYLEDQEALRESESFSPPF
jgi:hypothetical protein